MDITCTQNTETGIITCTIPFPNDNGIEYSNVFIPELGFIFIILTVWFFAWTLERLFFYITHRVRKAEYDS